MAEESGQDQGSGQSQGDEQKAQEEQFDKDRAMATIKAQRESEKALAEQLKSREAELKTLKDAQMSEDQRKTARLAELEAEKTTQDTRIRELRTDNALAFAAVEAGARHPKEVAKLIALADVKYDDDGQPTNAADLVEKLRKKMPEMFASPNGSADGGARGTAPSGQDMNQLLRQKAGRG